ncbi:MAG TPA: pentapeptide repeat-containing protein [Streptosporangiaceae bacterium]|nr:pentapeptide repeat-containing protein [Streptosporangiaceae bacterium]
MSEERQFHQGSRVDDLDLSGVHLHGTNLRGARLTETYLMDADISGDIEGLKLNGEWEHHRYTVRDLDVLDPAGASGS